MTYVQGAGKRKHILPEGARTTICGAWYFGINFGNSNLYAAKETTPVCKHCERKVSLLNPIIRGAL